MSNDLTQHYIVGKWKTLKNYQCNHCAYSTTNLARIEDHVAEHLPKPEPPKRVALPITDRFGNPIVIESRPTSESQEPSGEDVYINDD